MAIIVTCFAGGIAFANPAVNGIVGYLNLIDPALVAETRSSLGDGASDQEVASALLVRLETEGVLDPAITTALVASMLVGSVPQATFDLFLLDLVTGSTPLTNVLGEIGLVIGGDEATQDYASIDALLVAASSGGSTGEGSITDAIRTGTTDRAPGLVLPEPSPTGQLDLDAITDAVQTNLENPDAIEDLRDRYEDAISPRNPDEA